MSFEQRLMIDWHGLKRTGWPYSIRKQKDGSNPKFSGLQAVGGKVRIRSGMSPNLDPFPGASNFGVIGTPILCGRMLKLIAYFEAHGLKVNQDA